jgi:hypothetical protein
MIVVKVYGRARHGEVLERMGLRAVLLEVLGCPASKREGWIAEAIASLSRCAPT